MEWLMWFVYLLDVLQNVDSVFSFFAVILIFALAVSWILLIISYGTEGKETTSEIFKPLRPFMVRTFWAAMFFGVISLAIPSKTTMYTMLAIKAVDVVIETEAVQTLVPKSVEVVEQYLDNVLNDLRKNGEEEAAKQLESAKDATKEVVENVKR